MRNCPSFPSFCSQYKGENRKLGNLGNFQLPQTNKKNQLTLQVLRQFPSFPSFRFLYKGQNRKFENLENYQLPPAKQSQVLKQFPSSPSFRFLYKGQIENSEISEISNFLKQKKFNLETSEVFSFITGNKTEGVFEYSRNFKV